MTSSGVVEVWWKCGDDLASPSDGAGVVVWWRALGTTTPHTTHGGVVAGVVPSAVDDPSDGRRCTIDGCLNMHRAKGLCSTHYNQQLQPDRHPKAEVPCTYCGALVVKYRRGPGGRRPFCDYTCRDLWKLDTGINAIPRYPRTTLPADHPARWYGATCPVAYGSCAECGITITTNHGRILCSKRCSNRRHEKRRRKAKGRRHQARRLVVFERDHWTCHLCGEQCDPNAKVGQDWAAATVDHLVPRSQGGSDDPSNLKTAHWMCNTLRGTKPIATDLGGWGGTFDLARRWTAGERSDPRDGFRPHAENA